MNEASFAAALMNPDLPAPHGFAVYRNSVTAGLIRALQAGFPVVRQLVGDAFFTAMATEFLRAHPPRSQMMMLYGDALPGFLSVFPPVAPYPYLADVATLEQALRESYHAADAVPVAKTPLGRLTLAPSLRLVRSAWPINGIWQFHQAAGPKPVQQAEDVVILRPVFDPKPHLLPPQGAAFLLALQQGASVEQARAPLGDNFPLHPLLALLTENLAFVQI